jgi:hypothetical protein
MYTLTQSINWSQAFYEYAPVTAGLGQEPAVSTANMIRDTLTGPPMTWPWNRAVFQLDAPTTVGEQDYPVPLSSIPDFGFLEKVTLTETTGANTGKVWEIKDIYNNLSMSRDADKQRPNSACVFTLSSTQLLLRFIGVPNAAYTVTLIYQKRPVMFGPYIISAAGNESAGDTVYTGTFDPLAFPDGAVAQITGFKTNIVNNGSFVVVNCTATALTVVNAAGVAETITAYANNFDWGPIPDSYQDIYNNLFLSEMFAVEDDARSQTYRQRGIAAFLSKAEGLTQLQRNAFVQQWLARGIESASSAQTAQLGSQARGV